jgi:hypothetical protein
MTRRIEIRKRKSYYICDRVIILNIVTYDVAKPYVNTLWETYPRSRKYKKSNQQERRNNKFREVTTSSSMRKIAEYRVSAKCINDLANANAVR